jgi:D-alanyl-D-alanine carboxypeptidase
MRLPVHRILLLALTLSAPSQAQQADRATLIARIDSLTRDYMAMKHIPGLSIAVVRGSDTLMMTGFGVANRGPGRPSTASTVYRIGSITKQFTAAAIMRLVDRGKIALDDRLSKYLPDVPKHWHATTIRQLLNHTSGIHSFTASPEWPKRQAEDMTPRQIIALVTKDSLDFPTGTAFSYNNTGYILLGMILEAVSGQTYAAHLQRELFVPLGLTQTNYCPSHPTDTLFADGYAADGDTVKPAQFLNMTQPYAAGAICSTVRDLAKWQRALANGGVVSADAYRLMISSDTLPNGNPIGYGFGLATGQLGTHRYITHNGGINGFTSTGFHFPDDSTEVVILVNSESGPDQLVMNINRALFDMPVIASPKPPVAVPLADSARDRVPGIYDLKGLNGATLTIHVTIENGRLMAEGEKWGPGKFMLVHVGNLSFGTLVNPAMRLTFVSDGAIVTKLQLTLGDVTVEGPRRP